MLMEAAFSRNAYPGTLAINHLAEILDEEPDRIKRWFLSRRVKRNKNLKRWGRESRILPSISFHRFVPSSTGSASGTESSSCSHPSELRRYTYPFLSSACNPIDYQTSMSSGLSNNFHFPQALATTKPYGPVNSQVKPEHTAVNGTGPVINKKEVSHVNLAAPFLSPSSNFNMVAKKPTSLIFPLVNSSTDRYNRSTATRKQKKTVRRSLVLPPKPSSGMDLSQAFLPCEVSRDQFVPFVSYTDELLEDFKPPRHSTPMICDESSIVRESSSPVQTTSVVDDPAGSVYPNKQISPTPKSADISCNSSVSRSPCPIGKSNLLASKSDSSPASSALSGILSMTSFDVAQCDLANSIPRVCSTLNDCVASSDQTTNTSDGLFKPAAFPLDVVSESGWYSDIDEFIKDFNKNKDAMDR